jgi:putative ABC transport system permease protein
VLGLGIAAATAILAMVHGVLLRPLPIRDQERVIIAWKDLPSSGYQHYPFGDRAIASVGEGSRLLERVAGVTTNGGSQWVAVDGNVASYVQGALVTGAFFDVLDVAPLLGRRLTADDDRDGSEPVVVISAGLWKRRYGGSPQIVGRRLTLDDRSFAIVGVMPPDIDYPRGVELWRATRSVPSSETFGDAARQEVDLIGRLRPGVTIDQATTELAALTRQFEAQSPPGDTRGLTPVVRSFDDVLVGNARTPILLLLAAVSLVLIIATANVANLLLMRSEGRRTELAVRMAVGAGAGRIARQLMVESAVLSLLSAIVGLAATWGSLQWFLARVPAGVPRMEAIRIDGAVFVVVTGLSVLASLLAAAVPAVLAARIDPAPELRGGGRGVAGTGTRRVRRGLVVAQVALAVTVVAGAGSLVRSFLRLQAVDVGMAVEQLVVVFMEMPKGKYADQARHGQFLSELVESLQAVPGITAATPVNIEPFSGGWGVPMFVAEGQSPERAASNPALGLEAVHENYFKTLGVRIVHGRAFTAADRKGTVDVAIVSEDVAARVWPGADPIGERLKWGSPASTDPWLMVVGIAASTRYQDLMRAKPVIYVPAVQFIIAAQRLVLRTTIPANATAQAVRDRVQAIDPGVRVMRVTPFTAMFDAPLARPRFGAWLLGIFAGVALLLATVGHYAVIAAHVRQREREIAVRVALGATPWRVRSIVLAEAGSLAALGAVIGLAAAFAATRLLKSTLYDVESLDPIILAGAALALVAASAAASLPSLLRVGRGETISALRP